MAWDSLASETTAMNFGLEGYQKGIKKTARDYLNKTCTLENLLAAEASDIGFSQSAYREMGQLGWLRLGLPTDKGGTDDFVDPVLLYEEFGHAALAGPHFVSAFLGGQILLHLGNPTHEDLLVRVAAGERIVSVALYEETAGYDSASVRLAAEGQNDRVILNGQKLFVPFAHIADFLIVLARTGAEAERLTFFLVPAQAPGLEITPLTTLSGEKQFEARFHNVKLTTDAALGTWNHGWAALQAILPAATVLQAAELVGICDAAIETAVEYAKQRIAFGRPIGSFQAIQHKCADMVAERDAARFLTYQAACLINMKQLSRPEVAMAKAFAAAAARKVTKEAHQIFAGAGYIMQNRLNFYYRRAKAIELFLGDVGEELRLVAERLGL